MHSPKPLRRLLAINQVVGPLMRELLDDLSDWGVCCQALTGWVDAEADRPPKFERITACRLIKSPSWRRLSSWICFTVQAVGCMIRRSHTPVLLTTNPPLAMLAGPWLRRLCGLRYVLLIYDVYPEVLERMGVLRKGGPVAKSWRRLSREAMVHAAGVVTVGRHMAETLRRHLRPGDDVDIEVIPNWADTDFIRPRPRADNPFAREHGLVGKFVVMYSGAFGATHDTESIVSAAAILSDLPDVQFVLIGGGTREAEVRRLVAEKKPENVMLLPLQPLSVLPHSLTSADCAIVSLDEGYEGVSVPSKTYYALAAGAAVLAVSAENTELTELVAEHGCGLHVPPRDPQALAQAVRRLHADRKLLDRCRKASRVAAEKAYARRVIVQRYLRHLGKTLWQMDR
ncbi:MAG TPA: glycosyltransferase family 4 protein [Phycisphaerae bacterium]|nr:glycosyltransferase family 4 protein [Phycisphaerae bacterium]